MAKYQKIVQAEKYDGSAASVDRIMTMLRRTSGINNTPSYLMIDNLKVNASQWVVYHLGVIAVWSDEMFNLHYDMIGNESDLDSE